MSGQFSGKVVAITGAAGGIGRELCLGFGREGAAIAAIDRSDRLDALVADLEAAGIRVAAAKVEIGDADRVAQAFARLVAALGPVDILVNNAGVSNYPNFRVTTPAGWASDINDNLNGAYNCAHAVLGAMQERRAGAIVNISSVNGISALGDPAYSAAKAGMLALTRSIAVDYGKYGIRANTVLPGTVRTPIWDHRIAKNPEVLKILARWYPLGRIVEPAEIARVVLFLASDAASAVSGVALPVDCGLSAGNGVMASELTVEGF